MQVRQEFLRLFGRIAERIPIIHVVHACRDPKDGKFLELVAGDAELGWRVSVERWCGKVSETRMSRKLPLSYFIVPVGTRRWQWARGVQ